MEKFIIGLAAAMLLMGAFVSPSALAFDCTDCHSALAEQTVVHAPVSSGFCFMCHDSVDASQAPHKMASRTKMGLSYNGEALCLACHERAEYTPPQAAWHAPIATTPTRARTKSC